MSADEKKLSLWDVLENYADVRDELDDVLTSFSVLQFELQCAMDDISDDLDAIKRHLEECDKVFRRYKCTDTRFISHKVPRPAAADWDDPEEGLPFTTK